MEVPAWEIIYQDDEIKFGQADGEYALFYDGNTYRLSPIRYETALSPADFGLTNLKMSLVHAKKAGETGDGRYYWT